MLLRIPVQRREEDGSQDFGDKRQLSDTVFSARRRASSHPRLWLVPDALSVASVITNRWAFGSAAELNCFRESGNFNVIYSFRKQLDTSDTKVYQ